MKKRKVMLATCSAILIAVLSIGGTMAYFTDETTPIENIITMDSHIHGKLEEPNYDEQTASSYVPGTVVYKDPQLINSQQSIEAWVAVKVSIKTEDKSISYEDFSTDYATIKYEGVEGFNTSDYELIGMDGKDRIYAYTKIVKPGETTAPIFDSVQINTGIKSVYNSFTSGKKVYEEVSKSEYEASTSEKKIQDGKYYILTELTSDTYSSNKTYYVYKDGKLVQNSFAKLPAFNIDIDGYMIQSRNVDYNLAVEELLKLAGGQKVK